MHQLRHFVCAACAARKSGGAGRGGGVEDGGVGGGGVGGGCGGISQSPEPCSPEPTSPDPADVVRFAATLPTSSAVAAKRTCVTDTSSEATRERPSSKDPAQTRPVSTKPRPVSTSFRSCPAVHDSGTFTGMISFSLVGWCPFATSVFCSNTGRPSAVAGWQVSTWAAWERRLDRGTDSRRAGGGKRWGGPERGFECVMQQRGGCSTGRAPDSPAPTLPFRPRAARSR